MHRHSSPRLQATRVSGSLCRNVTGPLIGCLEFFGGLALIVGLMTRLIALGLAADMLGAVLLVHLAKGFFLSGGGYEFVLMLFAAAVALAAAGPGSFSVDELIARRTGSPDR